MIRIDDIFAAVLLSVIMLRRLVTLGARLEHNRHVPEASFYGWRSSAIRAHNVGALACFLKVVLSVGLYQLVLSFELSPGLLIVGGLATFMAWVAGLMWAWRKATAARVLKDRLGIVTGRPQVKR